MQPSTLGRFAIAAALAMPLGYSWWSVQETHAVARQAVAAMPERAVVVPQVGSDENQPPDVENLVRQVACLQNGDWPAGTMFVTRVRESKSLVSLVGLITRERSPVPSNPFQAGHPFHELVETRRQTVILAQEIEAEVKKLKQEQSKDVRRARELLGRYSSSQHRELDFYREIAAVVDGWHLRHKVVLDIDETLRELFADAPDPSQIGDVRTIVEASSRKISRFLTASRSYAKVEDIKDLESALRRQNTVADFLLSEQTQGGSILERMRRHARLLAMTEQNPAVLKYTMRFMASACDGYLPESLPIDDKLLVFYRRGGQQRQLEVRSKDVILVWDNGKLEFLLESGLTPFDVLGTRLERVIVRKRGTFDSVIKPTDQNHAASVYNRVRTDWDWSSKAILKCWTACEPVRPSLGRLWGRLDELKLLSGEFPDFFARFAAYRNQTDTGRMP